MRRVEPDARTTIVSEVSAQRPPAPEIDYWHGQMSAGADRAQVLLAFALSDENRANVEAGAVPANIITPDLELVAVTQAQWAQVWG